MKRLNLLPKELQPRQSPLWLLIEEGEKIIGRSKRTRLIALGIALLAFWIVSQNVVVWGYQLKIQVLKGEVARSKKDGARLTAQMEEIDLQKKRLADQAHRLESRREFLAKARQTDQKTSALLIELAEILPPEIWVTKLALAAGQMRLAGTCEDTQTVAEMMTQMDRSGRFRETRFAYSRRSPGGNGDSFEFEIATTPVLEAAQNPEVSG